MTEPGETDGYGVTAHLRALAAHGLPPEALDYVVVNTTPIPPRALARYAAEGARPVDPDFVLPGALPVIVRADLLEPDAVVRHAPHKLGPILCDLAAKRPWRGWSDPTHHSKLMVSATPARLLT
jgi:2-phospho-L-lactate transferase/gluconeogenesis factor (CofD/UPF0052 family)